MARDYFFAFGGGNPATNASLTPTFITFVNNAGTTFAAPAIAEKYPGSGLYYVSYGATQTMAFVLDGATTGLATTDRYIAGIFDPYDQFGVTLNAAYAVGNTTLAGVTLVYGIGLTASTGVTLVYGLGLSNIALGTTAVAGITLAYGTGLTTVLGVTLVYGFGLSAAMGITLNYGLGLTTSSGITLNYGLGLSAIAGITLTYGQGATIFTLESVGNTLISSLGLSLGGLGAVLGTTASSYGSTNVDPVDVMGYLKRTREFNEGNQTYTKATGLLDFYVRGGATLLIEKTISDTSTNTTKT